MACKIPNELEMAMSWLVDSLQEYRDKFPQTIVYSTSINDTSKLYKYITTELPHCSSYVEMYHRKTRTPLLKHISIHIALWESSYQRVFWAWDLMLKNVRVLWYLDHQIILLICYKKLGMLGEMVTHHVHLFYTMHTCIIKDNLMLMLNNS